MSSTSHLTSQQLDIIDRWRQELRQGQRTLADWQGGRLAVSAVPGAGKSHSMAVAAAMVIAKERLHQRRYLAIVTLTRSAAANIKHKIDVRLRELGLAPVGYTVSTIHSLALGIANKSPELSRMDTNEKTLVMPSPRHKLIKTCVDRWIDRDPQRYRQLLLGRSFDGEETERLRRQSAIRTEILPNLAFNVISEAKSSGLSPDELWELSDLYPDEYDILAIGAGLYREYQDLLLSEGYLDYDEMILGALRVLENDGACRGWQQQIYGVFEDEAQDSSPLQQRLLDRLAGIPDRPEAPPNLIRVGDPNQAINSTFTPADPKYFRDFCDYCRQIDKLENMNRAGRSTPMIINAANYLLNWGNNWLKPPGSIDRQPAAEGVFWQQDIAPVAANDPQPNPQPTGQGIELYTPADVYASIKAIADRLTLLFAQDPQASVAILVRENRQSKFILAQLAEWHRQHPEIRLYAAGESEKSSRIPAEMLALLQFMARPHSPDYLRAALRVLLDRQQIDTQDLDALAVVPERFLYPDILEPSPSTIVRRAKDCCSELLRARLTIPHYQLLHYLGDRLQYQVGELATADKLADRIAIQTFGQSSIGSAIEVLQEIVGTEGFESIDEDAEARYTATAQVTLITMHKSKGLDWDYVFIPFLHKSSIPGEPWVPKGVEFLGDYTLSEVARAKIRAHLHEQTMPTPDAAWEQANYLKSGEHLRLLYVAMTRAKKLLWMAAEQQAPFRWNTFNWEQRDKLSKATPSPAFTCLLDRSRDGQVGNKLEKNQALLN
jgi:DNA helicase II / ATP-dependent DNA helicase PcrA